MNKTESILNLCHLLIYFLTLMRINIEAAKKVRKGVYRKDLYLMSHVLKIQQMKQKNLLIKFVKRRPLNR